MWHAPGGEKTFSGPYALVLAYGIHSLTEHFEYCYDVDEDDHRIGYRAFAELTLEQKIWTLHQVAFGLLDKRTPVISLAAYFEAGVATIFHEVVGKVELEIDYVKEDGKPLSWHFDTRRAILAVHDEAGRNEPPFLEADEERLRLECDEIAPWKTAVEFLENAVLWDADYDMETTVDMSPEEDATVKKRLGIAGEYYTAIPHDPKKPEALKLLKEAEKLCERVIKREKKKLKT